MLLLGAAAANAQSLTAFYFTGSPLSFVSAGKTATLTPAGGYSFSSSIGVHYLGDPSPDFVAINVANWPAFWSAVFAAPQGQSLTTGTYSDATAYPSENPSAPGLAFSGGGAADEVLTGNFTILQIQVTNGQLISFAADFTQYDGGAQASWNFGSVRYNSSIPLTVLPPPPTQPLSVACTNPEGPVVKGIVYSYSSTCLANGGVAPYTWAIVDGQLPAGLTMATTTPPGPGSVTISGQPTAAGPFSYSVQVTDSQNQTAVQAFSGTTADTACIPGGIFRTPPVNLQYGPSGGGFILGFTFVSEGCPWTLTTDLPGVTFNPASGSTEGFQNTITSVLTFPANPDPAPRQGHIFLQESGQVVQSYPVLINSASCNYAVSPAAAHFGGEGGGGNFAVTASPSTCYPFVSSSGGSVVNAQADGGTYYFGVPPNTGPPRSGGFQVAASPRGTPVATFSWDEDSGNASLVLMCYPPGATRVNSTLAICIASGGTPPYSWTFNEGVVPGGAPSNLYGAQIKIPMANQVAPGPYRFTVMVNDSSNPAGHATYTLAGNILPALPQIQCSYTTGAARVGTAYSVTCIPRFGTPPYQWSVAAGTLPTGLSLVALDGGGIEVDGTPLTAGDYDFALQLTDSTSPSALIATQTFSGTVASADSAAPEFFLQCTDSVARDQLGIPAAPLGCSASGGVPPYQWSLQKGELPPGLTLSSSTGDAITIAGTPNETVVGGYFYLYLKVTDSSPVPQPRLWSMMIEVAGPPAFTCDVTSGQVGQPYKIGCPGLGSYGTISAGMLPPGLTLSSLGITGTPTTPGSYPFTVSLPFSYYPSLVSVSQSYTIEIDPIPASIDSTVISGAMAQIAAGGGWESTTVLVNPGSSYARAHVGFFGDDGSPASIPLLVAPGGASTTAAGLDDILPPQSVLTIDSPASPDQLGPAGWAEAGVDGDVSGFTRFRFAPWAQEALVPLDAGQNSANTLAYDNTNGIVTGVAVANLSSVPAVIPVIMRDDSGVMVASDQLSLPAMGHAAFQLGDRFAPTAGQTGTIEFDTPPGGRISVLGLRFPAAGHFTSIPVAGNSVISGGALAHLAVGGGWSSTIELVNAGDAAAQAHLQFFAGDGTPLTLPLSVAGSPATASALDQTLAPRQHLVIDSSDPAGDTVEGSAQLTTGGAVSGFIRFRFDPTGQEAIVPLETRNAGAYFLAFDNLNGVATGVALSNLAGTDASIPVIIRDAAGNILGTETIALTANGHAAFVLSERLLATANQTGSVEFDAPPGGSISVLGLRFEPTGEFSTIPTVVP